MTLTSTTTRLMAIGCLIALGAAGIGCGDVTPTKAPGTEGERPVGSLDMALTLPDGSIINTVDYSITGNGITPITGTIPISVAGSTISAMVTGIPAGKGYLITLAAKTTDGKSTCGGKASFDVIAGQTTQVSVGMTCRAATTSGSVRVDGTVDQCPTVTAFSVQPLTQSVGGTVTVTSAAADPENDMLTYAWTDSAGDGSFASPTSPNTTFTCMLAGMTTITVSVDDGHGCTDSASAAVNCIAAGVCGNGKTEPGEQCDDGNTSNTDACLNTCRNAACGDGFVQAGVEQCDDGNKVAGDGCEPNCTRTPGCGNGALDPGEQCDDGNNTSCDGCSAACKTEACGNGIKECAEVCDGNAGLGLGKTCAADCKSIVDNCLACETTNCTNYQGAGIDLVRGCYTNPDPTKPLDMTLAQECTDAVNCARTSADKCAYNARGAEQCYCGTATSSQCAAGTGINGSCKSQFEAAAGSTDFTVVTKNFGNRKLPIGNAVFLLQCDRDFCNTMSNTTGCVPQ